MNASLLSDQAAWPDFSSGEEPTSCYAGFLGRCYECDAQGSCICGLNRNGMSDLLAMDRSKWDGDTLFCPNYEPLLLGINAIACMAAAIALVRVVPAIRFQAGQARGNASHPMAPLIILAALFVGTLSLLLYSALKLGLPDRMVGFDPMMSIPVVLRDAATVIGLEVHHLHVVSIALNSQVTGLGEQRVLDAKVRQFRHCIIKATLFCLLGMLPLIQSICATAGRSTSFEAQTAFTLAFALGKVVHFSSAAVVLRVETRSLLKSFAKSIDAAHAGIMVALGGSAQVSLAERSNVRSAMATSPASSVNQTTNTPTPPYLQPLLDELDNLRTASENIRTNARDLFNSLAFSTCVWLMLAIIPPMWSRVSYFIPLMSLVWLFGSGSLVKLYAMRMARPARAASIIQHV